ncbi:MAG: DMT family transporter [Bacillota bacterium]
MESNLKTYILMVIATIFWAGAFIAGKLGINNFTPVVLTYLRIGLATLIIFPFMKKRNKGNWKLAKKDFPIVFTLGLVGMTGYHLLFFKALEYTTASNASVINAFNPIITAILSIIILKDKLSIKQISLVILAFIGVFLTITEWNILKVFSNGMNKGDLIMLIAATCWAIYSIIVKKGMKRLTPLKLTTYTFVACIIILTPFFLREVILYNALNVPKKSYLAIIYMSIFPTVGGYTIQQHSINEIGPSTTALFINLVPIFSIIMAVIFLNESFYKLNFISIFMVIFSVFLFLKTRSSKKLKVKKKGLYDTEKKNVE